MFICIMHPPRPNHDLSHNSAPCAAGSHLRLIPRNVCDACHGHQTPAATKASAPVARDTCEVHAEQVATWNSTSHLRHLSCAGDARGPQGIHTYHLRTLPGLRCWRAVASELLPATSGRQGAGPARHSLACCITHCNQTHMCDTAWLSELLKCMCACACVCVCKRVCAHMRRQRQW